MSDQRRELDLREASRQNRARELKINAVQGQHRSWQQLAQDALHTNALNRNWRIERTRNGQEIIEGGLHAYVRAGVRNYRWQRSLGYRNSALEQGLKPFLQSGERVRLSAKVFVEAAFQLAAAATNARTDSSTGAQSDQASEKAGNRTRDPNIKALRTSVRQTKKTFQKVQLYAAIARRDALVAKVKSLSDDRTRNSVISNLRTQLAFINTQIAEMSRSQSIAVAPDRDLDEVAGKTVVALSLRRSMERLSWQFQVATQKVGLNDRVAEARLVTSRLYLKHLREHGLRVGNAVLPVELVHPKLGKAIEKVLKRT